MPVDGTTVRIYADTALRKPPSLPNGVTSFETGSGVPQFPNQNTLGAHDESVFTCLKPRFNKTAVSLVSRVI